MIGGQALELFGGNDGVGGAAAGRCHSRAPTATRLRQFERVRMSREREDDCTSCGSQSRAPTPTELQHAAQRWSEATTLGNDVE